MNEGPGLVRQIFFNIILFAISLSHMQTPCSIHAPRTTGFLPRGQAVSKYTILASLSSTEFSSVGVEVLAA